MVYSLTHSRAPWLFVVVKFYVTARRQIPKHKESLPLADMSPVRHIYQKCEMRIRGLEHMACFPPPLLHFWKPGKKRRLFQLKITWLTVTLSGWPHDFFFNEYLYFLKRSRQPCFWWLEKSVTCPPCLLTSLPPAFYPSIISSPYHFSWLTIFLPFSLFLLAFHISVYVSLSLCPIFSSQSNKYASQFLLQFTEHKHT